MHGYWRCAATSLWLLALPVAVPGAASATDSVDLPPECAGSNLSPEDQARCDYIARTPNICARRELSDPTRRWCDQRRFAGEPLYAVVRLARNGAVRSFHVIETDSGREVVTAYPYGIQFAAPDPHDRERRLTTDELGDFLDGRPGPADVRSVADGPYASGVPIGWNDSTGIAGGGCLNFNLNQVNDNVTQETFRSNNSASSIAEQLNVSASVKASYEIFNANENFSFSNNYASSTFSDQTYFNFYSIWRLNLLTDGTYKEDTTPASASCGSKYIQAVPAGMFATMSINYGSSSSDTQTKIENTLGANDLELGSIQTAVTTANEAKDSSFYFEFQLTIYGGGSAADTLSASFYEQDESVQPAQAYFAKCAAGDVDACGTFVSNMTEGANEAFPAFQSLVDGVKSDPAADLSFFDVFPNSVIGVDIDTQAAKIPNQTLTDLLFDYKDDLTQVIDLVNQVATLEARANTLNSRLSDNSSLNPVTGDGGALDYDPASKLNALASGYSSRKHDLLNLLNGCLSATPATVDDVCGQVATKAENVSTAYDAFALTPAEANQQLLLQNTIALQYTGMYTNANGSAWPQDVLYDPALPAWSSLNNFVLIGGHPALVGVATNPYVNDQQSMATPSLSFLPLLKEDTGLPSAVLDDQVYAVRDTQPPGLWFGWLGTQPAPAVNSLDNPLEWKLGTASCQPTFIAPCDIGFGMTSDNQEYGKLQFTASQIPALFVPEGAGADDEAAQAE